MAPGSGLAGAPRGTTGQAPDADLPRRRAPLAAALLPALAMLLLGGCGFHLRGAVEVPPELDPLYIQAGAGSLVARALDDQLTGSTVALTEDPAKARLILRILTEDRSTRVAAVDSRGKVLAFELYFRVRYDAVSADGRALAPEQTLTLVRTFDNPDAEVLGKQLEERMIQEDFARDAADRILMRLRTALR